MSHRIHPSLDTTLGSFSLLVTAALITACSADHALAPSNTSLTPGAKPSATYILPYGCDLNAGTCGIVTTDLGPQTETLKICKQYPAGVVGPTAKMHIDMTPGNPLQFGTVSDFDVPVAPNTCVSVWRNGELFPNGTYRNPDGAVVTEDVANLYATTYSYVTVKRNALQFDPGWDDSTVAAPVAGVGASVGSLVIGGKYKPGVTVTFINTPKTAQGCTPGYWKQDQHFDSWIGYTPDQMLNGIFGVSFVSTAKNNPNVPLNLLQALQLNGNTNGEALFRIGTAALLNSVAGSGVNFPYTTAEVIKLVHDAWLSGNPNPTKDLLDAANNAGCPLN